MLAEIGPREGKLKVAEARPGEDPFIWGERRPRVRKTKRGCSCADHTPAA